MKKTRYEWLAEVINKNKYSKVAEIGVNKAETASYLLKNCKCIKKYIGVDKNVVDFEHSKFDLITGDSADSAMLFRKSFNLVFIDADHSYDAVVRDIDFWLPKIKKGGIICGHDYLNPAHRDVEKAVNRIFGNEVNYYEDALIWWVNISE